MIKHFPVVTVSHKILLPTQPFIASWLGSALSTPMANAVAGVLVTVTPGVAGFLVWELKSNWNLYRANRDATLKPVSVGPHGESLSRLLKPGFHSGAIGKVYGRMRRTERQASLARRRQGMAQSRERLRQIEVAVAQYVHRELFALWRQAAELKSLRFVVETPDLLPNAIRLRLRVKSSTDREDLLATEPMHLSFQAHGDCLVVKMIHPGWLSAVTEDQRRVVMVSLSGFYRLSGVDLVEEQVKHALGTPDLLYHIRMADLMVWAPSDREQAITYGLRTWGTIRPHPASRARALQFGPVARKRLLLGERDLAWDDWVSYWEGNQSEATGEGLFVLETKELLPEGKPERGASQLPEGVYAIAKGGEARPV